VGYSAADIAVEERPFKGRVTSRKKENNSTLPINHAQLLEKPCFVSGHRFSDAVSATKSTRR